MKLLTSVGKVQQLQEIQEIINKHSAIIRSCMVTCFRFNEKTLKFSYTPDLYKLLQKTNNELREELILYFNNYPHPLSLDTQRLKKKIKKTKRKESDLLMQLITNEEKKTIEEFSNINQSNKGARKKG